jgi:hypothetical protein
MVRLTIHDGRLKVKDQMRDYQERSTDLDSMSMLSFLLETYDGYEAKRTADSTQKEMQDISLPMVANENQRHIEDQFAREVKRGRPKNQRYYYREGSGREKEYRVQRSAGHETMPDPIGKWFPRMNEDDPLYTASILTLLKPWRTLQDIKGCTASFTEAFKIFIDTIDEKTYNIIENADYFHQSSDAASRKKQELFNDKIFNINVEPEDMEEDENAEENLEVRTGKMINKIYLTST